MRSAFKPEVLLKMQKLGSTPICPPKISVTLESVSLFISSPPFLFVLPFPEKQNKKETTAALA
jgi:hypothetical protein